MTTDLNLDAIEARANAALNSPTGQSYDAGVILSRDVPALVAALREARAEVAEWRRVMARPHPGDPCWETHGIEHQDSCACCERDEARAEAARWHDDYLATHKEKRELTTIVVQQRAERDDWRRRYEALRDGVTGLCDEAERRADPGVRLWSMPEARIKTSDLRAVVVRVEGDES